MSNLLKTCVLNMLKEFDDMRCSCKRKKLNPITIISIRPNNDVYLLNENQIGSKLENVKKWSLINDVNKIIKPFFKYPIIQILNIIWKSIYSFLNSLIISNLLLMNNK